MRIVIDLQGAQTSGSRFRGIGRYSLALAQAMAQLNNKHEIWIALNNLFPDTIESLRAAFEGLVPQERIVVWHAPGPVAETESNNRWRLKVGECLREAFLASLKPDVVHISSLFEGFGDDALASVGMLESQLPTAVTLYDLIPLIYRDPYLTNPAVQSWYERKLGSLRRARLCLAISESSRREGIDHLNLPEEWVVNISTAADAMFQPVQLSADQAQTIRQRYGLTRPFIMYTGGIDHRKNIEGLISAYAKLPPAVRADHQLAIVCSASEAQIEALKRPATKCGLASDEVVFTGYIPDADMVALYSLCAAFVFPSWHEGFGLPALEAMSCGAAVIGANTSSLPEVIGRADALFDPRNENDMATKLHAVLTDDAFRGQLKHHGLEQAKKFSWDNSARLALEAFERLHAHNQTVQATRVDMPAPRRPRLAYVSPLPPEQSGIADYSAELLPELARHYDIEVIVHQPEVADSWIRANCPIRSAEWFDQNAHHYDRVLYHFGNSSFHQHMFRLLAGHPGTVVLHDFYLSGIIAHMELLGYTPSAWGAALYASHGYHAVKERFAVQDAAEVTLKYPANLAVLQQANGVIVHSEHSRALANLWYGVGYSADWACIPLLRKPPTTTDKKASRSALELTDEDFLICSFGMLGPTKLNHCLLAAWLASPLAQDPRCHLVFVGENHGGDYGAELLRTIKKSFAKNRIHITGFVHPELYRSYLAAADIAVQLRTLSRGETSAAVLDCMAHALPTIVNANGAMAELSQDCVLQLSDEFADADLRAALVRLWRDPPLRQMLGERAQVQLQTYHHPRKVADQYRDAIERFANGGPQARTARLTQAIAELKTAPVFEHEWLAVAQTIATNHPTHKGAKQLLVDVSEYVQHEAKSGIQRVVRSVLHELLASQPLGYRIEPIYASDRGYCYARSFTMKLISCPEGLLADGPVEVTKGDVFLGLDLAAHLIPHRVGQLREWRNQGAQVYFVIYDLLPIINPLWFPQGTAECFAPWLETLGANTDGAVCISRAVADELAGWLDESQPARQRPFKIGWFHLGADINASLPTNGVVPGFNTVLEQLRKRPSVLMVGTLEPRKGHAQSLAAFVALWERGVEANLLIVGKPGWNVEALIEQLHQHPQAAQRLFWFESANDEMLLKLYEAADGLLMASEGEGFGLPLIEAAQHKLPILARDIPVFREVASEHASYFSGTTTEALANALDAWLKNLAAGRAPKSDSMPWLTWKKSTQQLTDVILKGHWHTQWKP